MQSVVVLQLQKVCMHTQKMQYEWNTDTFGCDSPTHHNHLLCIDPFNIR